MMNVREALSISRAAIVTCFVPRCNQPDGRTGPGPARRVEAERSSDCNADADFNRADSCCRFIMECNMNCHLQQEMNKRKLIEYS